MTSLHKDRVNKLRDVLRSQDLAGFIIPRADEHLAEYVAKSSERLAFISGFTGSAGMAIILPDRAVIFSDGRYDLQLETETDAGVWERWNVAQMTPESWLTEHAAGLRIGYDPWLISSDGLARFAQSDLVPVGRNLIDEIWDDRAAPPLTLALPHDLRFSGEDSAAKRARLAEMLRAEGQDTAILTDPAAVAWLFNLRGADVEFTPVSLSFAFLNADATATIFIAASKVPDATRIHLGNQVTLAEPDKMRDVLAGFFRQENQV